MKIDDVLKGKRDHEQIAFLRKKAEMLEAKLAGLRIQLGEQREVRDMIRESIAAADPFPRVPWSAPAKADSQVHAVFSYGDWHTGAIIKASEIEGINAFNWKIQQRRIHHIVSKEIEWISTQRNGYRIDDATVFGLADWVSGNIHKELSTTNEFPVPEAAVKAGMLLGEVLVQIAAHFEKLTYVGINADNHGRLDLKPQFKQKATNSWSYVVHAIARAYTAKLPNLEFVESEGIKIIHRIAQHNFLVEHGDTIRGWAGLPFYGMARMKGKEATRRMKLEMEAWRTQKNKLKQELGFDYYFIGHFHQENIIDEIYVNGSLTGTDEFDHGCGRFAKPCQVAMLVHPKHGIFNWVPFRAV